MAGGKTTLFADEILALVLNGDAIPNIADNAHTSPLTEVWVSLHVSSPGAAGVQNTNEATYAGYARVGQTRMSGGSFSVLNGVANPVAPITFPTPTGGAGQVLTFAGIGTSQTGAGKLLYWGPITPNIMVALGVPPVLTPTSIVTEA